MASASAGGGGGPQQLFFDVWSRFYDLPAVQRAIYRPVQDAVITELIAGPHQRVLDVGCGTGLLTSRLAAGVYGTTVVGCDFSFGMLSQASAGDSPVAGWVQGDAQRLPVASSSFDAVVCTESFHWYPDQSAALAEFRRVLRPGGRALIAFVNPPFEGMAQMLSRASEAAGQPATWQTAPQMRSLVSSAGLTVVAQQRIGRLPGAMTMPPVLTVARRP